MRRFAVALALALLAAPAATGQGRNFSTDPAAAPAGEYVLDKRHASVIARVSHQGFSNYSFMFRGLEGRLDYRPKDLPASKVTFTVDPASADTGLPDFDKALGGPEWLNAAKSPARFVSTRLEPTGPRSGRLTGDLTLNGVTKPVTFEVAFNGGGLGLTGKPTLGFSARGTIKRSEFGVSRLPGIPGETVTVLVEAEFDKP